MLFSAFDVDKRTSAQSRPPGKGGCRGLHGIPGQPQVLADELAGVTYCLLPVLPVLGAGVVVLLPLPEPMPLELGEVGLVVLPLELEPEPLVLLPEAPLPAL